jgi:hypothetical protein
MELALHQADTLQLPHDGAVHVKARHADGALAALAYVLSVPALHREVARRGGNMREIPGLCTVAIEDPSAYLALNPERRLDPWVALAEFPWLIAGRSDVAWISAYLPRAVDFSDNGKHWRAGYGPRLRQWGSFAAPRPRDATGGAVPVGPGRGSGRAEQGRTVHQLAALPVPPGHGRHGA